VYTGQVYPFKLTGVSDQVAKTREKGTFPSLAPFAVLRAGRTRIIFFQRLSKGRESAQAASAALVSLFFGVVVD
jgi:hypothetical protein